MPRFSFPKFLWLFGVGNAVVWFGILFGVSHLIAAGLSPSSDFSHSAALWTICIVPLFTNVLAMQGSVVNLRVQYLEGQFDFATAAGESSPVLHNPWRVAATAGWLLCVPGIPIALAIAVAIFPQPVSARLVGVMLGTLGAISVLVGTRFVSAPEFQTFIARIGHHTSTSSPVVHYLLRHLALPWGVVNLVLNAILASVAYSRHLSETPALVSLRELRGDLASTSVILGLLIGLAATPEAECDAVTGAVEIPAHLPTQPPLHRRLLLVAALATFVWLTVTAVSALTQVENVSFLTAIVTKAVFAGFLAAASAAIHGCWSLARSRVKHAQWMSRAGSVLSVES